MYIDQPLHEKITSMKSKYKLGSAAGIGVFLHWSFVLFAGGMFLYFLFQGATVTGALLGLVLLLAVFGFVVLHEYGHALMAKYFGIPTEDITLYPIGGVARLRYMPKNPWQELWIALAGPAVNVALAAFFIVVIVATGASFSPVDLFSVAGMDQPWGHIPATLLYVNVALVVFNMLPAFPMDGGRVLRSILAINTNHKKATRIASRVGQGMALLFGFLGFLASNPMLIFIAFFVFMGARQEAQFAETEWVAPHAVRNGTQVDFSSDSLSNEAYNRAERQDREGRVIYHDPVSGRKIIYIADNS